MSETVIERYEVGGPLLVYATSGLSPEHLRAKPGPGDLSIAELAIHLVDCDLVFAERFKRVIAETNPTLQAFDETPWMDRFGPIDQPAEEAVQLFALNRAWMGRILRACSEADFARVGQHTELGPQTLASLLAKAITHLDHHLKFLYAKRANLRMAVGPKYAPPHA